MTVPTQSSWGGAAPYKRIMNCASSWESGNIASILEQTTAIHGTGTTQTLTHSSINMPHVESVRYVRYVRLAGNLHCILLTVKYIAESTQEIRRKLMRSMSFLFISLKCVSWCETTNRILAKLPTLV
ncbi:unnamed protein product [Ixodes pacificus]